MNRTAAVAAVVAVLGFVTACGHPKQDRMAEALGTMTEYTDKICACKDKACADQVTAELTQWSANQGRDPHLNLDDQATKKFEALGERYGKCLSNLYGGDPQPAQPPLPAGETVTSADRIVKLTFDEAGKNPVGNLELSYVRGDGTMDPTYGRADIEFRRPKKPDPADDPSRPLGAPVPVDNTTVDDMMAKCPVHTWTGGVRSVTEGSCAMFGELTRPRCSVVEVWKQAIEAGAPAAGLAVLRLRQPGITGPTDPQQWQFSIDDAPRKIHFSLDLPDTCDPTLERPTPVPPKPPVPDPGQIKPKYNPY